MIKSPWATKFTRTGELDMKNKKPYRTKAGKEAAREKAKVVNGTWVSSEPVKFHK